MPMNQMPCLQVDGKRVNQSLACCRYLSRELGLAGNDDWENLQIDTIADTVNDFRLSKMQFLMTENVEIFIQKIVKTFV